VTEEKDKIRKAILEDQYLDRRVAKFEGENQVKAEEYNAVFLPWGPGIF
jgi:hypothetical protein